MSGKRKKKPGDYRQRSYRELFRLDGMVQSTVLVRETDLAILAARELSGPATHLAIQYRNQLENYLHDHPVFLTSLVPLPGDPLAPPLVREMLAAAKTAGVGPMAAVAGVLAEYVGRGLIEQAGVGEVVVENGGDIFMALEREGTAAIFAGESPLSNRFGLRIPPESMPAGICTSSGTVGHSLSFGRADSVTVLAENTALADAVATRLGNELEGTAAIKTTLAMAAEIPGIRGVVIVMAEQLGVWGRVELIEL